MARSEEEHLEGYWGEEQEGQEEPDNEEEPEGEGLSYDELSIDGLWFMHGYDE